MAHMEKNWTLEMAEAMERLVAAWDAEMAQMDAESGERESWVDTMVAQLAEGTQGWDAAPEDAEAHPELARMVGLDMDAEDTDPDAAEDAWARWEKVVADAARTWLERHPADADAAKARWAELA